MGVVDAHDPTALARMRNPDKFNSVSFIDVQCTLKNKTLLIKRCKHRAEKLMNNQKQEYAFVAEINLSKTVYVPFGSSCRRHGHSARCVPVQLVSKTSNANDFLKRSALPARRWKKTTYSLCFGTKSDEKFIKNLRESCDAEILESLKRKRSYLGYLAPAIKEGREVCQVYIDRSGNAKNMVHAPVKLLANAPGITLRRKRNLRNQERAPRESDKQLLKMVEKVEEEVVKHKEESNSIMKRLRAAMDRANARVNSPPPSSRP